MWAYKFITKDTRLQVPRFKTFFFANQELLQLWYEDEYSSLEERVNFPMRCLKYFAHLFILWVIVVAVIDADDT